MRENSSKQRKLKQHAAACWSHCQQAPAQHHCPNVPTIAKQTFYPASAVTIKPPPAHATSRHNHKHIKKHQDLICSYLLREVLASPSCGRIGTVPSLPSPAVPGENLGISSLAAPGENFGSFPSSHLPGENFGFVKMAFTCMRRAKFLGLEIIGRQHPIYEKKKVSMDNEQCTGPGIVGLLWHFLVRSGAERTV